MSALASLALTTLLLLAQAPAYSEEGIPIAANAQGHWWARAHAENAPLTWHWRRYWAVQVELTAVEDQDGVYPSKEWPATLDIDFSSIIKISDHMTQAIVAACAVSVHDEASWPKSEWDRALPIPGAMARVNILPHVRRWYEHGGDGQRYWMAQIAAKHAIVKEGRYLVAVYCRARNGNRPGELIELRPEHNSYGFHYDQHRDRHMRGPRPGADGVGEIESYWYDSDGLPQNHLTVEVR